MWYDHPGTRDEFGHRFDLITAPDPLDVLSLAFVRDKHLRVPNDGDVEDEFITRLIKSVYFTAERVTRRCLLPQTRQLVIDHFPFDRHDWPGYALGYLLPGIVARRRIVIPMPPLISVTSVEYIDPDGNTQTLDPSKYTVSIPRGPRAKSGYILPNPITSIWPVTQIRPDAVTITVEAGYALPGSPAAPDTGSPAPLLPETAIPEEVVTGMLLWIGEHYKQRSESIDGRFGPAVVRANDIWMGYRAY